MLKPLHNYVLIAPAAPQEHESGLILGAQQPEINQEGKVIAVGQQPNGEPLDVSVDDIVYFSGYAQNVIEHDGGYYYMVPIDQIMLIMNPDGNEKTKE